MKVQADVNGIFEVTDFDGVGSPYQIFVECLKDCEDGEVLECELTGEQEDYLEGSYGIKKL